MAINERIIHTASAAAEGGATGNQEEGLMIHYDANDVDSYDGDGTVWYDITNHEYTPATDVSEHFNTVLYTGTGANQSITGFGFNPDLIWTKRRDGSAVNHHIFDTLRGNYALYTSTTDDQDDFSSAIDITSSNEDGFDVIGSSSSLNNNTSKYVAWGFKAGGTPTSSNPIAVDGTNYASLAAAGLNDSSNPTYSNLKLSVNTDLGFSMVHATGSINPATCRFPHGLGQKPDFVITKTTDAGGFDWIVWHKDLTSENHRIRLSKPNGEDSFTNQNGGYWSALNTTDVMTLVSSSTYDQVYYSFVEKRGVSKFGSYIGNGGTTSVDLGFKPAFVMVKRIDSSSDWVMYDNKRGGDNLLFPHLNYVEGTYTATYNLEFNTDGFSISSGYATNGGKYIYMAFAERLPTELISTTPSFDLDLTTNTPSNATVTGATYDEELGNFYSFTRSQNSNKIEPTANVALTDRTIEMWVNPTHPSSGGAYLLDATPDRGYGSDSFGNWTIYLSSATIVFVSSKYNGSTYGGYYGNHNIASGEWAHIAMTCSGTTTTGYVNGVEISEVSATSYNKSQAVLGTNLNTTNLGRVRDGGNNTTYGFDGKMGQVRIYDTALTQDEIVQNYKATIHDYPNGTNATTMNSPTWNANGYWEFDGGTSNCDGFSLTNSLTLKPWFQKVHTVSMWVNFDSFSSYPTIWATYDYYSSASWGTLLRADNDGRMRQSTYYNNLSTNQFSNTLYTGQWYHVVASFSQGDNKLYIDNSLVGTTTGTFHYPAPGGRPAVGCLRHSSATTTDNGHHGKISKFKLYDRFLTADEIQALYDEGE